LFIFQNFSNISSSCRWRYFGLPLTWVGSFESKFPALSINDIFDINV